MIYKVKCQVTNFHFGVSGTKVRLCLRTGSPRVFGVEGGNSRIMENNTGKEFNNLSRLKKEE
jgi:hypothetical protein